MEKYHLHLTVFKSGKYWSGVAVYKDKDGHMAFNEKRGTSVCYSYSNVMTRHEVFIKLYEWIELTGKEMIKEVEEEEKEEEEKNNKEN